MPSPQEETTAAGLRPSDDDSSAWLTKCAEDGMLVYFQCWLNTCSDEHGMLADHRYAINQLNDVTVTFRPASDNELDSCAGGERDGWGGGWRVTG